MWPGPDARASCAASIVTAGTLYAMSLPNLPADHSLGELWSLGFGAVNPATQISLPSNELLPNTLLANTPQIVLSMIYFAYNSIFTCELVAAEWNEFGRRRKPLRVTSPRGQQLSTYYLGLPYAYGLPLMGLSVLLHWLFSRAIFLTNVVFIDPSVGPASSNAAVDSNSSIKSEVMGCGYSPVVIVLSLIAGCLTILVGLVMGLKRYAPGIPMSACSSAAMAAAGHRAGDEIEREGEDLALLPLRWGVVMQTTEWAGDAPAHCSFSSRPVTAPIEGGLYQ